MALLLEHESGFGTAVTAAYGVVHISGHVSYSSCNFGAWCRTCVAVQNVQKGAGIAPKYEAVDVVIQSLSSEFPHLSRHSVLVRHPYWW